MADFRGMLREAVLGALEDGELSVDDFDDWKVFKKKARKELRQAFKRVEEESIEVDPMVAALVLLILHPE